jgi:outer membrane murein-binding lipoprotein Lpp
MKNRIAAILVLILIVSTVAGCSASTRELEDLNSRIDGLNLDIDRMNEEVDELNQEVIGLNQQIDQLEVLNDTLEAEIVALNNQMLITNAMTTAYQIMELIKDEDWIALEAHVHPTAGVRFSPYQYVDAVNDQVMTANQVGVFPTNTAVLNWGTFDGSGEPINLNSSDYYSRFIYEHDFYAAPVIGNNYTVSFGNMINNITIAYPTAVFVEFYYPQFDPQYGGMDWRSLTLVLENVSGTYYLVGVVHGEWTI